MLTTEKHQFNYFEFCYFETCLVDTIHDLGYEIDYIIFRPNDIKKELEEEMLNSEKLVYLLEGHVQATEFENSKAVTLQELLTDYRYEIFYMNRLPKQIRDLNNQIGDLKQTIAVKEKYEDYIKRGYEAKKKYLDNLHESMMDEIHHCKQDILHLEERIDEYEAEWKLMADEGIGTTASSVIRTVGNLRRIRMESSLNVVKSMSNWAIRSVESGVIKNNVKEIEDLKDSNDNMRKEVFYQKNLCGKITQEYSEFKENHANIVEDLKCEIATNKEKNKQLENELHEKTVKISDLMSKIPWGEEATVENKEEIVIEEEEYVNDSSDVLNKYPECTIAYTLDIGIVTKVSNFINLVDEDEEDQDRIEVLATIGYLQAKPYIRRGDCLYKLYCRNVRKLNLFGKMFLAVLFKDIVDFTDTTVEHEQILEAKESAKLSSKKMIPNNESDIEMNPSEDDFAITKEYIVEHNTQINNLQIELQDIKTEYDIIFKRETTLIRKLSTFHEMELMCEKFMNQVKILQREIDHGTTKEVSEKLRSLTDDLNEKNLEIDEYKKAVDINVEISGNLIVKVNELEDEIKNQEETINKLNKNLFDEKEENYRLTESEDSKITNLAIKMKKMRDNMSILGQENKALEIENSRLLEHKLIIEDSLKDHLEVTNKLKMYSEDLNKLNNLENNRRRFKCIHWYDESVWSQH
jgi:hypothetical protein